MIRALLLCGLIALAGCAPKLTRPAPDAVDGEKRLSEHESRLFERERFDLNGKIAISDGQEGGSGRFEWQQRGPAFTLRFFAPISARNWRLESQPGQALLIESNGAVRVADSAADLIQRELRWRLPTDALRYWVLGMRAPGATSELEFTPNGELSILRQSNWEIRFLEYDRSQDPPLPRKVFARSGQHQVRISIRRWRFDAS